MKYKLLALDLDGTLLNSNSQIDKNTFDALRICLNNGIKIVFASGRLLHSMEWLIRGLNVTNEQIILNGAVIVDPKNNNVLEQESIPSYEYIKIINTICEMKQIFCVFDNERYYAKREWKELKIMYDMGENEYSLIDNFNKIIDPIKIIIINEDDRTLNYIKKQLINYKSIKSIRTGKAFLEIVNSNVSKGRALKKIADIHDIKREEILAIGDSENDIEMLQYAGMGIAMGNAFSKVKDICDDITDTNDDFGVLKALLKYVFTDEKIHWVKS